MFERCNKDPKYETQFRLFMEDEDIRTVSDNSAEEELKEGTFDVTMETCEDEAQD